MKKFKYNDTFMYRIIKPVVIILVFIIFHPKVKGKKNLPKDSGYILVSTHTSILDPVIFIGLVRRHLHFLAKMELFKGKFGFFFNRLGLVPVDRKKPGPEVLMHAKNYLDNDKVVFIFPEGTTQKGRGLLKFKTGAVKLAKESGKPIVPCIVKGSLKPFINNLEYTFLEPIYITGDIAIENDKLRSLYLKDGD